MTRIHRYFEDDDAAEARRSNSLAALAVTLALVVAGLYLVKSLQAQSAYQTCVLSGQIYCSEGQ